VSNTFERATAFFLFGSLQQFFFDGNKRTSRFMMNGVLMSEGIDAISIPAVRAAEFNTRMVDFYTSRDATEMMGFVLDCHPEVSQIRQLNPGLSAVRDLPDIKYFGLNDSMQQTNRDAYSTDRGASADSQALSLEDTRRQARENWRRNYYDKRANQLEPQKDSNQEEEHAEEKKSRSERDDGLDFDPER
jgi:hypothetical protein